MQDQSGVEGAIANHLQERIVVAVVLRGGPRTPRLIDSITAASGITESPRARASTVQVAGDIEMCFIAHIELFAIGAIIRERATCTCYSLEGNDAPTRTHWVKIDGEYNMAWAARQPNAAAVQLRVLKE